MSNLVKHAQCELELAKAGDSLYGDMLPDAVLEIIKVFSTQGHSGKSAGIVTQMVEKLMRFEPLTPLTGDDDEWTEVSAGLFQNKRCSHIFWENGEAYDGQGRIFREPDGSCFQNSKSRVPVTFPYTPKTEYVDVPESTDD